MIFNLNCRLRTLWKCAKKCLLGEEKMRMSRLRVLDPNLPFLASEAAIDLRNLLSRRPQDMTAIRNFAELLNNSIEFSTTGSPQRSLMDPVTETILGQAIGEAMKVQSLKNVDELLNEAAKVAKLLSSDNLAERPEELSKAKDFCIALSRAAILYHKSINDVIPSHPFRR